MTKNYPDTCNPGPMGEKVYSDTHMRYSCEGRSPRTICPAELNAGFVQTIIRRFGSRIKGCGGTMAGERWHEAWTLDAGIDPGPAVFEGANGEAGPMARRSLRRQLGLDFAARSAPAMLAIPLDFGCAAHLSRLVTERAFQPRLSVRRPAGSDLHWMQDDVSVARASPHIFRGDHERAFLNV